MKLKTFKVGQLVTAFTAACLSFGAHAQFTTIQSPDWEIEVTDYGFSDYLGDLTPGFEGREYLSGEWAGAVSYQGKAPTWLEPDFLFPDWRTNSNFSVVQPMALGSPNSSGLPTASSIISNGTLGVTQKLEIVDTVTGMAMGTAAASGATSSSLQSNRYVLMHSYTFQNMSSAPIENLQFFQFLHGLNSQSGVYDNRDYGGAMSDHQYDVTQSGQFFPGAPQLDYIGFHSKIAPTAFEIGRYGIEGVDDHAFTGKPSVGTHLSVEANSLNNVDNFAPDKLWVGGAQRFDLGTLNPAQSRTFDIALSIRTGYQVDSDMNVGSIGGGSIAPGGIDYNFSGTHDAGTFFIDYALEDAAGIATFVNAGEFGELTFGTIDGLTPLWDLDYSGSFSGPLELRFGLDPKLLSSTVDTDQLRIYHWVNGAWEDLGGSFDASTNTFIASTDHLSPLALGVVPEPHTYALMLAGLALLGYASRRTVLRA